MTATAPKRLARLREKSLRDAERREQLRTRRFEARKQAVAGAPRRHTPAKASRLDEDLERTLQERAAGRCECCGRGIGRRCQRHHRKLRSQGGLNEVVNLVIICANCHNMIHLNRTWARANGWIVDSHRRPASVPVTLHDNRRVRLTTAGGYQQVAA